MIMSPQQLKRYAEGGAAEPYVAGINVNETSMDGNTQQLLYGLDGQGGFIPGAMRAAERSFFDEQGRPLVTPQEIAGFSPDQQAAFEMAREQVGSQKPFLEASQQAYEQGLGALGQGQQAQLGSQQQSLSELQRATGIQDFQSQRGLSDALGGINQGQRQFDQATGRLRSDLDQQQLQAQQGQEQFNQGLQGAASELQGGAGQQRRALDEQGQMLRQSGDRFDSDLGRVEGLARDNTQQFAGGVDQATNTLQGAERKLNQELTQAIGEERGAVDKFGQSTAAATQQLGSAVDRFGNRLSEAEQRGIGALDDYSVGLDESRQMLRGSVGEFDPITTDKYMNPYEDKVVGQMIQDATKGLAQGDMAQTARDIQSGGESAFGSRARLTAEERAEAMGRGLAKEVGGLRAQGFQNAQSTAMGEFARNQQAQRGVGEGLASLGGQGLNAQTSAANTLSQGAASRLGADQALSGQMSQDAQSTLGAERSIADRLSAAGGQRFGAGQAMSGQQMSGAQANLGAGQNLVSTLGSAGQQRLAAGRAEGEGIGAIGQQQMNVSGQLAGQMGDQAQQRLGASNQYGQNMSNMGQQRYGAGTGQGQNTMQMGQARQDARSQMGNTAMQSGATMAQGYGQMGQLQGNIGQQQMAAQQGYGGFLQGLGNANQAAGQQQMNNLMTYGGMQQGNQQAQFDAQRAAMQQAQMAPLNQYNAMMPFVNMGVGAGGSTQISTAYTPPPSALQAGLATGLGALGAAGTYMNQGQQQGGYDGSGIAGGMGI